MKNSILSNISLTKIESNIFFYTDFYSFGDEKYKYNFDLSEIYERKKKIKIFLHNVGYPYAKHNFDSINSLLDFYLKSAIEYLDKTKSEILNQNIFSKLINKNKNIYLIKDIQEKIDFLNNLFYGSSFEHINQRFKFIQKHFDFCFVRNHISRSLSNDSIKINIFKLLDVNDVVFSLKKDSNKLRKLTVVNKYVKFRFEVKQYISQYFQEKIDIYSEDYYSFTYELKDIETGKFYYCSFNHNKKCYELSNNELFFLNYEEFEKYINNLQLNIETLKSNNGVFNL